MALCTCHRDDAKHRQSPNISEFKVYHGKERWDDLQREIDYYNTIIEWDDMWDLEIAQKWLQRGDRLFLFKPNGKVKGWLWVTTRKEIKALYINPKYRNVENARDLLATAGYEISKKWAIWWAHVEDWNLGMWYVAMAVGWKKVIDFHDD